MPEQQYPIKYAESARYGHSRHSSPDNTSYSRSERFIARSPSPRFEEYRYVRSVSPSECCFPEEDSVFPQRKSTYTYHPRKSEPPLVKIKNYELTRNNPNAQTKVQCPKSYVVSGHSELNFAKKESTKFSTAKKRGYDQHSKETMSAVPREAPKKIKRNLKEDKGMEFRHGFLREVETSRDSFNESLNNSQSPIPLKDLPSLQTSTPLWDKAAAGPSSNTEDNDSDNSWSENKRLPRSLIDSVNESLNKGNNSCTVRDISAANVLIALGNQIPL